VNVFGYIKLKPLETIEMDFKFPFELFKNIYKNSNSAFLLESMESDNGLSRLSVIGFNPVAIIKAHGNILKIDGNGIHEEIQTENPFHEIKKIISSNFTIKGFTGGLVGYVSYEASRYFEDIETYDSNYPEFQFGLFLDSIIFDRSNGKCHYVTLGENRADEIYKMAEKSHEIGKIDFKFKQRHYSKEEYIKMVKIAKEKIKAGEIFQSVLSNAREYEITGDKLSIYKKLREMNPSPYMYHLKLRETEIIGSSPEMLLRIQKNNVETFPIAGTRKRGKTNLEDIELENKLLNDEKELAEHLMLVDLARNDLGRVCKIDSIKIPEYMTVKKFSHVQHIVSHVKGTLKEDLDAIDAFSSIFPAGTLSGAPKIRAMEVINEIEKNPRGPYGGALGYFSMNGNADFAIIIRTLICNGNKARLQAGAGIVHDSVPEDEYQECENKAEVLQKALEAAKSYQEEK